MSYRKVNYLELCWYILKAWMRHKHHPEKEKKCQENQNEAVPIQDVHDLPKYSTARIPCMESRQTEAQADITQGRSHTTRSV